MPTLIDREGNHTKIQTENEGKGGIPVREGLDFFRFEGTNLKSIEREVEEDRDMPKSERDKRAERTGSKAATKEKNSPIRFGGLRKTDLAS
jgi:hypothetical protein